MIGKTFCSQTRFVLDGAIKGESILNSELGIFNIHENLATRTGKDFIVRQPLDGASNLISISTILGTRTEK
jgi:hypothetical protein